MVELLLNDIRTYLDDPIFMAVFSAVVPMVLSPATVFIMELFIGKPQSSDNPQSARERLCCFFLKVLWVLYGRYKTPVGDMFDKMCRDWRTYEDSKRHFRLDTLITNEYIVKYITAKVFDKPFDYLLFLVPHLLLLSALLLLAIGLYCNNLDKLIYKLSIIVFVLYFNIVSLSSN